MVDRMEKKGWVVRRPDAADRRVNRLHLTTEADADPGATGADRRPHGRRCAGAAVGRRARAVLASRCGGSKRQLQAMLEPDSAEPVARAGVAEELVPMMRPHPKIVRVVLLVVDAVVCRADRRRGVAARRPHRRHRGRLCQGRHRADRAGSVGPRRRGAGARPRSGRGRRRRSSSSIPSRSGWRSTRPRPSSTTPAPTVETARAQWRETESELAEVESAGRLPDAPGGAAAGAGRQRRRLDHQARRGAERGRGRARPGRRRQAAAGAHAGGARRQSRDRRPTTIRWCAKRRAERDRAALDLRAHDDRGADRRHRGQCANCSRASRSRRRRRCSSGRRRRGPGSRPT